MTPRFQATRPGGSGAPPPEHDDREVSPSSLRRGDIVFLGDRYRTVSHPTQVGGRVVVMLYSTAGYAAPLESWPAPDGTEEVAVWRPRRVQKDAEILAASDRAAGRAPDADGLRIVAVSDATRYLGERLIAGIEAIPPGEGWAGETAHFDAFGAVAGDRRPTAQGNGVRLKALQAATKAGRAVASSASRSEHVPAGA